MYAVVTTGGKQVRGAEGDTLRIEKLDAAVGDKVELGEVEFVGGDGKAVLDEKGLGKAKVMCTVTGEGRRKKIRVFKYKRRKNYHRTKGHRQSYTEVTVDSIKA
jgi:large subunit ribosomal protein L21